MQNGLGNNRGIFIQYSEEYPDRTDFLKAITAPIKTIHFERSNALVWLVLHSTRTIAGVLE